MKQIFGISCLLCLLLSGCEEQKDPTADWLLAQPIQVTNEEETQLANLSELIELSKAPKPKAGLPSTAELLYRRAALYSHLGFYTYAQSDLLELLRYEPNSVDAYNFIGTLAAEQGQFEVAYDTLNRALELDPNSQYSYLNRALALYRNQRYEAALDDAVKFWQFDQKDPFRILWRYLIEKEINQSQADAHLTQSYATLQQDVAATGKPRWGTDIIAFYLGKLDQATLMAHIAQETHSNLALARRLCEAYFYLGKFYLDKGNKNLAEKMFKLAISNNIYDYLEHHQAIAELDLLHRSKQVPEIVDN